MRCFVHSRQKFLTAVRFYVKTLCRPTPCHLLRSTLTGAGVLLKFVILHSDCINNNGSFKTEPEDKNSSVIYLVCT